MCKLFDYKPDEEKTLASKRRISHSSSVILNQLQAILTDNEPLNVIGTEQQPTERKDTQRATGVEPRGDDLSREVGDLSKPKGSDTSERHTVIMSQWSLCV